MWFSTNCFKGSVSFTHNLALRKLMCPPSYHNYDSLLNVTAESAKKARNHPVELGIIFLFSVLVYNAPDHDVWCVPADEFFTADTI